MFQSVLINTYARRVKTAKYSSGFLGTIRSWCFTCFHRSSHPAPT